MDGNQELSPAPSLSSKSGLKGVVAKARLNSRSDTPAGSIKEDDVNSERGGVRNSVDSLLERARNTRAGSTEDGLPSGPSNLSKLVPGRVKKKRKKREEAERALKEAEENRGRSAEDQAATGATQITTDNRSRSTLGDGEGSLTTFDSDPDADSPDASRPVLSSHNSHIGYLTSTSPLIKTTNTEGITEEHVSDSPLFNNPQYQKSSTLPTDPPEKIGKSKLAPQHAATFGTRRGSSPGGSQSRGVSPGAKIKDAFSIGSQRKSRSPPKSPSLNSQASRSNISLGDLVRKKSKDNSTDQNTATESLEDVPSISVVDAHSDVKDVPKINTTPSTPTNATLQTPETTVTPPTPEDLRRGLPDSPSTRSRPSSASAANSNIVVSPSGNMISHRRIRSDTTSTIPSKLSQAMPPPMTPMAEESKTPGGTVRTPSQYSTGAGFFSSVFSAAQNMTSTLTGSIANPPRSRSSTATNEDTNTLRVSEEAERNSSSDKEERVIEEKKPLAKDTLGSGELSLSHLGISTESLANGAAPNGFASGGETSKREKAILREEAAARVDDASAARAVSAAFTEKSLDSTPVAEDVSSTRRPKPAYAGSIEAGEKTPPASSIYEGADSIRRSGSVRSRVRARKHRNSSSATGNTIGSTLIAGGASLINPSGTKTTGYPVASIKRNREFHQLFRSVPEDDLLIEDYSCALQREIIIAGRIYISEGHICFFSNILGWTNTLVISFSEVVSMEKEYTAMVFPNAIAIQTLHARNTFRSLLSREATYDLLIGIWKVSHPNLKSSVNGARLDSGTGDKTEKIDPSGSDDVSEATDDLEDVEEEEDQEEDGEVGSLTENGGGSVAGSTNDETGTIRKISAIGIAAGAAAVPAPTASEPEAAKKAAGASAASIDFPGPAIHAPTECPDQASHLDKALTDDIIPAPLGKVYSMTFGPASGGFMSRWLADDMKCTDLQFEHDGKGLTNENKSRSMTYIKPLYAPIGPKTTKCLVTETLDFMDLEKAVCITASTQTPDVPSGGAFVTKTHFCFMWAPNNATRAIVNYTIDWTGKSWLKTPIEKGATEGQTTYCNDLIKGLKAGVRSSTIGAAPKKSKGGKRRLRSASTTSPTNASTPSLASSPKDQHASWGPLEPLHGLVSPITDMLPAFMTAHTVLAFLVFVMVFNWLRGPKTSQIGTQLASYRPGERMAAFEELWHREESELWDWLDARVGVSGDVYRGDAQKKGKPRKVKEKTKGMSEREIGEAIRMTEEKLGVLKKAVVGSKGQENADQEVQEGLKEAG